MLGDRDLRGMIEKALDEMYEDLKIKIDRNNSDKIHAIEASRCTRLAYYERKDPLPPDNASRVSALLANSIRHSLKSERGEFKADALTLEASADMVIADEFVVCFEVVQNLPEIPDPRHLLYLNACLFALKKEQGFLIYMAGDGKSVEFSVTKSNRMFEEIIRRARVLSTLLKEGKVPIVEPSDLCISCKYYERCYARKHKEENSPFILDELFKRKR
jgi:CRISPR-associated exonuclease Cas4